MAKKRRGTARGIYRDRYGYRATVKVGDGAAAEQREKRFPFDTPIADMVRWQDAKRAELRAKQGRQVRMRGTLEADAKLYLDQVKQLVSWKSRRSEVEAWLALYGRLRRSQLTSEHVRKARATWAGEDYAPKTINNRVQTLQNLYHVLDGPRAWTPADDVAPLEVAASALVLVPAATFRAVAANLKNPKTRARFMVIASTGVRPSELKRVQPPDIDLARGLWTVRTGKGGEVRALVLNDDMAAALAGFAAAEAWGPFCASSYAKALYRAGWPKDVRPYQARHSVALELGERGIDLGDVQGWLGHKHVATTRRHYLPVQSGRLKHASETLAGRFGGWEPATVVKPTAALEAMATSKTLQ